jgi:hypothetical protein
MTRIEHPFAKVYRAVLKEKYPVLESAIPEGSSLVANGILEDVVDEALKRYYAGETFTVWPGIRIQPASTIPEKELKGTIVYV